MVHGMLLPVATLNRMRVTWSGSLTVGPGVSTFYFLSSGTGLPAAVLGFYNAIKGNFSSGVSWTVPNGGDQIDSATGALVGAWTQSGGGTATGTAASGSTTEGVGVRVVWLTSGIRTTPGPPAHTYRVRGSTFLTSLNTGAYAVDGLVGVATAAAIKTAAQALIAAAPSMEVWSRPTSPGAGNGAANGVTDADCPRAIAWLRTRKT